MIHTVRVRSKRGPGPHGPVETVKVYRLEGFTTEEAGAFAQAVLSDPIDEEWRLGERFGAIGPIREIAYKPGMMNPRVASIMKAASMYGMGHLRAADTSLEYHFGESLSNEDVDRMVRRFMNANVQQLVTADPESLIITGVRGKVQIVPIRELDDVGLMVLSKDKLFLNLEEMRIVQAYYLKRGRDPYDGELETIAQTWSEHCNHKTFRAKLIVDGVEAVPLFDRLKSVSHEGNPFIISRFVDNSGVIEFYDGYGLCAKVETHNSPSALDPYGGAATGSGGVFRDIMGTGQGAKVIYSTDIFCVGPMDVSDDLIPHGCLHPQSILTGVVSGVRDYGNRMGIPTGNGSVHFHRDFRAKPTIIVGSYGLIPIDRAQKGTPRMGDIVIVMGGRTGRDGIHGATFSSAEMTERTATVNSSAVQIGNAIEEKRTADALLTCRDRGYVRAVTDCGAGGFSSAIGEMGAKTGVRIFLERAPVKYTGLAPWEIWVSESQERMVVAVDPTNVEAVLEICRSHNVEAVELGVFTDDGTLSVTYEDETVCDLEMEFLHNGLPQRTMIATSPAPIVEGPDIPLPTDISMEWERVMGHGDICSKEPIVRMYDHSVQGGSVLQPYGGVRGDAPNDAAIITPILGKPYGAIFSHGLNPVLNRLDPYWGTLWAAAEALANYVAVGGNPRGQECALVDNFIWPFPDEYSLYALHRAVDACVDFAKAFGLEYVSGKDSLSSTYRGKDGEVIHIPPVTCISVFGRVPDVAKTVSSDFKKAGNTICRVGHTDADAMGGSAYYDLHNASGNRVPRIDLERLPAVFWQLHELISAGEVLACHDVSEGGIAVTLAEMCFGGNSGAEVDIGAITGSRPDHKLFQEQAGSFLVEVSNNLLANGKIRSQQGLPCQVFGWTTADQAIRVKEHGNMKFAVSPSRLKREWQRPMKEVFHGG